MNNYFKYLTNRVVCIVTIASMIFILMGASRPYYEAPKDYREQIEKKMAEFQSAFGYELVELGKQWTKKEVEQLHSAFAKLPPGFFNMKGMKAIYRLAHLQRDLPESVSVQDIPAATFPAFNTIYRHMEDSYNIYIENQDPRLELFNGIFYEDPEVFENIVHHEMGHAYDIIHGFLSFSKEWLEITQFRLLHLPALDGTKSSDFLFTLLNDPKKQSYAPVSQRHVQTYSRTNPQEDFANSIAAYIHYPYFRYSHPKRYSFLKKHVFKTKEYFPAESSSSNYQAKVVSDLKKLLLERNWKGVVSLSREVSRDFNLQLYDEVAGLLEQAAPGISGGEDAFNLATASCYLFHPKSVNTIRTLAKAKKINSDELVKQEVCQRISRDIFQDRLVKYPLESIYFFQENGVSQVQFLDPVLQTAYMRGYRSTYTWKIFSASNSKNVLFQGKLAFTSGNGSVNIPLRTASGKPLAVPEDTLLILQIEVERQNTKTFKRFNNPGGAIRFKIPAEFHYIGTDLEKIRPVFPLRPAFKDS